MDPTQERVIDIREAMTRVNALVRSVNDVNVLTADVGEHLNPGDVYDAYEATQRTPTIEHVLEAGRCGPFAAVFLHRNPSASSDAWLEFVLKTFHPRYVAGFLDGFRLSVPESASGEELHYLRGLYDGVMAHAAVF